MRICVVRVGVGADCLKAEGLEPIIDDGCGRRYETTPVDPKLGLTATSPPREREHEHPWSVTD